MLIEITYSPELSEFRVQGDRENTEPAAYYTDEICDAVDTARSKFGQDIEILFELAEGVEE